MGKWIKITKLRVIIGICLLILAVIAGVWLDRNGFTGPESQMWQRMVFIVSVLGTGLAALAVPFAGWVGAAFAYGFVTVVALPRTLPDPWNRYFSFLYLGGILALSAWLSHKQKHPTKAEDEPEDEPLDEEDAALEQILATKPVIVKLSGSGSIYQLLPNGHEIRAYRVGSEAKGVDVQLLQSPASGRRSLADKDFTIPISSIRSVLYKELDGNRRYDCVAVVKTEKRKYRFMPTFYMDSKAFRSFWESIAPDSKAKAKTKADNEPVASEQRLELFRKVRMGLYVCMAVVSLCWLFLDVPYQFFAVLSLLLFPAVCGLYILFPDVFIMRDENKRTPKLSLGVAALLSGCPLMLRATLDYNLLSWKPLLIAALILGGGLLTVLLIVTKEWRSHGVVILYLLIALAFYSIGAVTQVNGIFDHSEPVESVCQIVDKHISTSSKGPDTYYITVMTDVGELELKISSTRYEAYAIGDEVTVTTREGLLGIPYANAQ